MGYKFECRWFTGYKPCKYKRSCEGCPHFSKPAQRIAIVSLEAMGAVLRSTCLLPAIKRKYPSCHITWITYKNTLPLLANNPYIDRIIAVSSNSQFLLQHLRFDIAYGVDKSMEAGALIEVLKAPSKFGFGLDNNGCIRPLNPAADYQFDVGLNDQLKFFVNKKPETQQLTESMGIEWKRDPYVFRFRDDELAEVRTRRLQLGVTREDRATVSEEEIETEQSSRTPNSSNSRLKSSAIKPFDGVIGYNTGCSSLYANKKLSVVKSIELVRAWRCRFPGHIVLLLGGREDEDRHVEIKSAFADDPQVVASPTNQGLRSGIMWVACADVVFSGCSLGMHIAIALQKKVVAWYGVSCEQEVDLYDRGEKILTSLPCSPCWKKTCGQKTMCYDQVQVSEIIEKTSTLITPRKA